MREIIFSCSDMETASWRCLSVWPLTSETLWAVWFCFLWFLSSVSLFVSRSFYSLSFLNVFYALKPFNEALAGSLMLSCFSTCREFWEEVRPPVLHENRVSSTPLSRLLSAASISSVTVSLDQFAESWWWMRSVTPPRCAGGGSGSASDLLPAPLEASQQQQIFTCCYHTVFSPLLESDQVHLLKYCSEVHATATFYSITFILVTLQI